jgi:hypothetical protein
MLPPASRKALQHRDRRRVADMLREQPNLAGAGCRTRLGSLAKEFIGLKNGGKKNDYTVEGILFQSDRLWNKNQRWAVRRFKQT